MSNIKNCSVSKVSFLLVLQSIFIVCFYWKPLPLFELGLTFKSNEDEVITSQTQSSQISSQCVAMFNIGYGSNVKSKSWNTFLSNETERLQKVKKKLEQQTEDYFPFTKSLVKLVDATSDGTLKFSNGTRLKIMKGKLPYVPCSIRDYSNEDFHECVKVRKERNEPLWIAYFGDSRARNKLFYLLNSTHSFMNWTMDDNSPFNEEIYFQRAEFVYFGQQMEFVASSGARMTLIATPFGEFREKNEKHKPADVLLEWSRQSRVKRLPDILLVEFGCWQFSWTEYQHIGMHEMYLERWKQLHPVLRKLSSRMSIICHVSTRIKISGIKHQLKLSKIQLEQQRLVLAYFNMKAAVGFIDQVMKHGTKKSNIIFWDSTLPFSLASDLECELLVKHNHSSVAEEGKLKSRQFLRFMCNDITHQTIATIHDERSVLLNLACNKFLFNTKKEFCCTS